ncbi:MAG: FAD binding domain-containing protein [Anaerolineae bacterium]|nr:FAD binding domain-containing protein [Anaerolineae bacterium]
MKLWEHYHTPTTVDEALSLLAQYAGRARIIAGGTDLLVEMRAGEHEPHHALIDITRIAELTTIARDGEQITIGAGVTHTQIVHSALLQQRAACLVESCGVVGGPQVRNVATLGGNVAHALPAGDGTVSLVALGAEAEAVIGGERRWHPIQALYLGPGKSLLNPARDVLLRFRLAACGPREGTAFDRIMRPQGVALPILGCAVRVRLTADGTRFERAQLCIAPLGPTPERLLELEVFLVGKTADEVSLRSVIDLAQSSLHPRASKYRASAEYRREMIGVLLERTLTRAVERARAASVDPR